jgi:hypothetical protein
LQRLETLPEAFTVFHSVKWFAKTRGTVGEIDFLTHTRSMACCG